MENIEAASLNIAILPSPGVRDLAIGLSQKVAKNFQTEFVLDEQNFMPHVTIYQAHFPVRNIDKIKEALGKIVSNMNPFYVTLDKLSINYGTFIFWDCFATEKMREERHLRIVHSLNPLRDGLILPVLSTVTGLAPEDKEDIELYGSLLIGPRYKPHITITRISNPKDADGVLEMLGDRKLKEFAVDEIILGYLGPNATVSGVIETFKFGK